ncbi:MAG: cytochrome c-type biogenesis protein CcmH [Zoogloeaceae bacterium]|jgi:cytochrome c-type biogenesis protein CcmH|nr:cytochrome c-type biogenesis protein CcmH [Zoogloeaceae bacterium]
MNLLRLLTLCLALFAANSANAEEARPLAADPVTEQRLLAITGELRCLVCQNETIAASNADLANDLREQIRGMIQSGKSDDEIIDFLVTRYGDYVLYRPPVKNITLFLWGGPLLFFIAGIFGLRHYLVRRNRQIAAGDALSDADKRLAEALLAGEAPVTPDPSKTPPS